MLAYLGIEYAKEGRIQFTHNETNGNGNNENDNGGIGLLELQLPAMSCSLVEKLVKVYKEPKKCHRSVFDQDRGFLTSCVQYMKTRFATDIPV